MKKILIDKTLYAGMDRGESLRQRTDVKLYTAATNDELLSLHRAEKMDLIISRLDAPGMPSERLFAEIRNDASLRAVSQILFCRDQPDEKARAERCGPTAVMTLPVNSALLLDKAQSLLKSPSRGSYRVLISVSLETSKNESFFCRSENISVTGLLLETDRSLAPGDQVICSFFLPGAKQIVASGEIVRAANHADKSGMKRFGVKFAGISPADIAAIDNFVKKKSGKTG
jgi:DNA-binding response OmpR family regulator